MVMEDVEAAAAAAAAAAPPPTTTTTQGGGGVQEPLSPSYAATCERSRWLPSCVCPFGPRACSMIAAGSLALGLSMGIRHTFGVFLEQLSEARGWGREVVSLGIAVQNMVWGVTQPFTGLLSDSYGAGYVTAAGSVLFSAGLVLTPRASSQWQLELSLGLLVGLGLSCLSFPIVFGAISRALSTSPHHRSQAIGLTTALTSAAQSLFLPTVQALDTTFTPHLTLQLLGYATLLALPASLFLLENKRAPTNIITTIPPPTPSPPTSTASTSPLDHFPTLTALRLALPTRTLWLLSLSFFICGFHVVFIGTHISAYLADQGMPPSVGIIALALIGLFNVPGTVGAGYIGAFVDKPRMLAVAYAVRAAAIVAFMIAKVNPTSTYLFACVMGLCWLATVPLTNAIIASVYGVRHMSLFAGITFLFHQIGSFLSGWLGGYVYDNYGSYKPLWMTAAVGGAAAVMLVLPVKEAPLSLGGGTGGGGGDDDEVMMMVMTKEGRQEEEGEEEGVEDGKEEEEEAPPFSLSPLPRVDKTRL